MLPLRNAPLMSLYLKAAAAAEKTGDVTFPAHGVTEAGALVDTMGVAEGRYPREGMC